MGESPLHNRGTPITFTRPQAQLIRTALRLGKPLPPCPHCGGALATGDPVAGGGTVGPVWQIACASCHRNAFLTELPDGRQAADDGDVARRMPDDFIALDAVPSYRVMQIVRRHWPQHTEADRQRLVSVLRPLLEPLAEPGATITEDIRALCEAAVRTWLATITVPEP
jgi:hypothetical protein